MSRLGYTSPREAREARKRRERRCLIIAELTKLSHIGWDKCRREDWELLEAELASLPTRTAAAVDGPDAAAP